MVIIQDQKIWDFAKQPQHIDSFPSTTLYAYAAICSYQSLSNKVLHYLIVIVHVRAVLPNTPVAVQYQPGPVAQSSSAMPEGENKTSNNTVRLL